jgi:hypothetical protein
MSNLEDLITPLNEIKLENKEEFEVLVINPNKIDDLDWKDPEYLEKITQKNIFDTVKINPNNFIENITKILNLKKFKDNKDELLIKTECISESREYIYEIMYFDIPKKEGNITYDDLNQLGILLDINGELIFGKVILLKTHVPLKSTQMYFENSTKTDVKTILNDRINNYIVTYKDDEWNELRCNNIEEFKEIFFEEDKYKVKHKEMAFLSHNVNILYTTFEYAEEKVCGKLLEGRIDKCIFYTVLNEKYKGNLSLDEVTKIIKLSNVLESYKLNEDESKDENDEMGRKILKTKNRVLEKKYSEYF